MRMRTRSPLSPCMNPPCRGSEPLPERDQLACQEKAAKGGGEREERAAERVQSRATVLTVLQQRGRLVTVRGECGVPAAESGGEQGADLEAHGGRGQRVADDEAQEQAPRHVDEERA